MNNPKLSLIGPAIRPLGWQKFVEGLYNNDVDYEVIFLGPNPPVCALPNNYHYIETNVKPAQCYEAGVRISKGELIMLIVDDTQFIEDHPLDKLVTFYESFNDSRIVVSCMCMFMNVPSVPCQHIYGNSKLLPSWVGLRSKEYYYKLGGLDSRFLASYVVMDLDLRVWKDGGRVVLSSVYCNEDYTQSTLWTESCPLDDPIMQYLWLDEHKNIKQQRTLPIIPFTDYRILEESQEPKGRWI